MEQLLTGHRRQALNLVHQQRASDIQTRHDLASMNVSITLCLARYPVQGCICKPNTISITIVFSCNVILYSVLLGIFVLCDICDINCSSKSLLRLKNEPHRYCLPKVDCSILKSGKNCGVVTHFIFCNDGVVQLQYKISSTYHSLSTAQSIFQESTTPASTALYQEQALDPSLDNNTICEARSLDREILIRERLHDWVSRIECIRPRSCAGRGTK